MSMKKLLTIVSCLTAVGLLMASCAPAVAPTATPQKASTPAKTTVETPAAKPTMPTPSPKPGAEQPRLGGVLTWAQGPEPASFDIHQESGGQHPLYLMPAYNGLLQYDPSSWPEPKIVQDLASSWEISSDGLEYTFRLKSGVKWHDGKPFTSEDVKLSLDRNRTPPRGMRSPRQAAFRSIAEVQAVAPDTVRIRLQRPSAALFSILAIDWLVVLPKHVVEAKGDMKRDILGTGPYKFKSFTPGASFEVVKNKDYFIKGRPYLDGITWYIVPDIATRFAALRTHRVQVTPHNAYGLRASQSELVRKEFGDKITVNKVSSLIFYAFWMPYNKAPWNDVRVRRAVDMAIDREKAIKVAVEGQGDLGGFMPPGGTWALPDAEFSKLPGYRQPKDADIAEAKRLLAEAGYAQGIKTTTITRNAPQFEKAMVALKEQLAPVGIDITVSLKDLVSLSDMLYKRNFDTAYFSGSTSFDDPDLVFGQNFVTGLPRNFSDFSDEKFDKWYDEQSRLVDPVKRKQIVLDMQRRMFELVPSSVLFWGVFEQGVWNEVKGLGRHNGVYNNLKFQDVWLAQ